MVGFLPTGSGAVSVFWSVRLDRIEAVASAGVRRFRDNLLSLAWPRDPLMAPVSRLPWVRGRRFSTCSPAARPDRSRRIRT